MQASAISKRKKRAAAFMHVRYKTLYLVWAWLGGYYSSAATNTAQKGS